jgi:hemerythrin superfamily protein
MFSKNTRDWQRSQRKGLMARCGKGRACLARAELPLHGQQAAPTSYSGRGPDFRSCANPPAGRRRADLRHQPAGNPMPSTATKSSAKTSKGSGRKPAARRSAKRNPDAIDLLTADHKDVKKLFKAYDKLVEADGDSEEKQAMALQICAMLTAHATAEEEIFYPAAREVLGEDEDLVDEADVEHASAKELIAQIEAGTPDDDPHYDAKVKVLGEYIDHHVKEEEGEMFPKVRKSDLDLDAIGEEIAARKAELLGDPADAH